MAPSTLVCALLAVAPLLLAHARDADDPARLVRGQEEWPESVGCPIGFVRDLRPKAQKQFRPGYIICAKGNIANCVIGTSWFMVDRMQCLKCVCHEGNTADCKAYDPCPPPKPKYETHFHYNCKRRDRKVCPHSHCKFLSRGTRCVNCDCSRGH